MPHKHTRREKDPSTFDLPPTQIATPLPVKPVVKRNNASSTKNKKQASNGRKGGSAGDAKAQSSALQKSLKRKRASDAWGGDAPRDFKRLMAFAEGKKLRSGLDDGMNDGRNGANKKKKEKQKSSDSNNNKTTGDDGEEETNPDATGPAPTATAPPDLTIRPGERMADFSRRVDAALPLAGLATKTVKHGKDPLGLKVWQTHKERQMQKLYAQWREEDRVVKEKREEERELEEERGLEAGDGGGGGGGDGGGRKGKKSGKKRARYIGEVGGREEDPWDEIRKKRGEPKVGLHDVATAPPELKAPGRKLVVHNGAAVEIANVPRAAGSLSQREKLQGIRDEVVASYRRLMDERRSGSTAAS